MSAPKPTTKRCRRCNEIKPLEEFHRQRRRRDGRRRFCKPCRLEAAREWRAANLAAALDRRKAKRCKTCGEEKPPEGFSYGHDVCKACRAKVSRAWYEDNRERVAANARRRAIEYPQKGRARAALYRAVKSGAVKRKPCEKCGAKPRLVRGQNIIEGHHHKGYEEKYWLDVQWLCRACHALVNYK